MSVTVEFDFATKTDQAIPAGAAARACAGGRFCWIDFDLDSDPDRREARSVLAALGVDGPTVELALAGQGEGRHDFVDEVVHLTVKAAEFRGGALHTSTAGLVLGQAFLVSLHHGEPEFLGRVRRSYQGDFQRFARSPGFLLYEFWDHLIASYRQATRGLGDQVRDLQRQIHGGVGETIFARVAAISGDLLAMRRVVLDAREVLSQLCTRRTSVVSETTRPFLEKMVDALERIVSDLTVERETVAEALNLYLAVVSYRTNLVINRLTLVSLVFMPLTFLCGVYGMNFKDIPEYRWEHGYVYFWVVAILISAATLRIVRRQHWW